MKITGSTVVLLTCLLAVPEKPETPHFTSERARRAQAAYESVCEELQAEFDAKLRKARLRYMKSLKSALRRVKKSDPEEAERIGKTIADLERQVAEPPKPRVEKIGGYTFTGGSGKSIEQAIKIVNAADSAEAVAAERAWFTKHYPGYRKSGQALHSRGERKYDEIELTGADGTVIKVYFDITDCFGFPD